MSIFKQKNTKNKENTNITENTENLNETAKATRLKIISVGTAFMIALVIAVAGVAAYFTDNTAMSNVFTIGNVDITLTETRFDSTQTMANILPGQVIEKNPAIQNVGVLPAYVYLKVTVPKEGYTDKSGNTETGIPFFTYSKDSNWTEMPSYRKETDTSITKIYYYNTILQPHTNTTELFQTVTVANFPNFDSLTNEMENIEIYAYAIDTSLPEVEEGENEFIVAYETYVEETKLPPTIMFASNGGTGTMENQVLQEGATTNITANSFTKEGYTFSHWNTKADGTGRSYNDKQQITDAIISDETLTLYAQWYDSSLNKVKYAVQIYGINQDVDANGNTLGLTFGPAVGTSYKNSYVTHEYDDNGDGTYNVMIVTHNVAEDGSETIASRVALTNSEGETVTRTEAQKQNYDINLHEMSWAEIEAVGDKSKFLDCMLCGDTKSVNFTLNSTISSGTKQTAYGDGAGVLRSTINDYYRRWNPAKSNFTSSANNSAVGTGVTLDSNEQQYGSNAKNAGAYKTSHIRATLIGSDVSNPTIGYAGDVNLDSTTCLYSCIESGLKDVITPKKVKYVTGRSSSDYDANNTPLVDSIWLLSNREVYGTGEYSGNTTEGLGTNGDGYSKFGNTESKYYMSAYNTSSTANRIVYNEAGSAYSWWLRSPVLYSTYNTYCVYGGGYVIDIAPYGAQGLGFGFCIR